MADSNGGRIITPPTPMKITQIAVVVRDMVQALLRKIEAAERKLEK